MSTRDWTSLLTPEEVRDLEFLGIDWEARLEADLAMVTRLAFVTQLNRSKKVAVTRPPVDTGHRRRRDD